MTPEQPWYQRASRWGQTNLVEADPGRFDLDHWREQWRRTTLHGVVVNCGGIAAYYPSQVPHHTWAPGIDQRDLFGEIVEAARAEGLAVLARMDSNRGDPAVFEARPDWFCVDAEGVPMMRGDKYATCVSTTYYDEFIPEVMTEASRRYEPDGFADNGWAGVDRSRICHCEACARSFHRWSRAALPTAADWDSDVYREWIRWSYARRTELWENNNAATRAAGGEHCRWLGMLHGQLVHNANVFQDVAAIAARTPLVLLDHQRRHGEEGFEQNAEVAKRTRALLGGDKPLLECTAMYDMGYPAFRLSSMPAAEVALWITHGWAGGTSPWWHHIGSVHEDRRQYDTAVPWFTWHADHEELLRERDLVADVAVAWSQQNLDFYGRDDPTNTVIAPYAGITRTLNLHHKLFTPVHVDAISGLELTTGPRVLVLPALGAMSEEQCRAVREYVDRGGSVLATGDTSLFDEDGRLRPDFALADLFGAHATERVLGATTKPATSIEVWDRHSYLRLDDGDLADHPALTGLQDTRTISFGGALRHVEAEPDRQVPITWVPPFPIFPPEISWMREPRTDIPALVLTEPAPGSGRGRVAFLPADLDRCAHREEQFDHAAVLAGLVSWLLAGRERIAVSSAAPIGVNLYRSRSTAQPRLVVHLTSLLYDSKIPGRQSRITPYGEIVLTVRGLGDCAVRAHGHVDGGPLPVEVDGADVHVRIGSVHAHEVVTLTWQETGP